MTWLARRPRSEGSGDHDRATALAAQRLDGPLDDDRRRWLDRHVAGCERCSRIGREYAEQRALLRRLSSPPPPRDLWARTAAAIEGEARRDRSVTRPILRRARPPAVPLGVLSGALVVAVVVTASLLSTPTTIRPPDPSNGIAAAGSPTPAPSLPTPGATPIAVAANLSWVERSADGTFTFNFGRVDSVCPAEAKPDCAPIQQETSQSLALSDAPRVVVQKPNESQFVIMDSSTRELGGAVRVVVVPTPQPSPSPSAEPSATPDTTIAATPSTDPSQAASTAPSVSPPSTQPSVSTEPSPSPSDTVLASPTLVPASPSPSPAGTLAILSDVVVVGETAAYSPDGSWFAFTARPDDGSQGPDIYVWRPEMATAEPVTTDHSSVFSGWAGELIVGSAVDTSRPDPEVSSFLLDPSVGNVEPDVSELWRPAVSPNGRWALGWDGTVANDGVTILAQEGQLVLERWDRPGEGEGREPQVVVDGPVGDWDARWDETGERLALWVADPSDPSIGKLSLYEVNPSSGRILLDEPLLAGESALPGFAIGNGRLAWATPPGENGESSRVEVLAWTTDGAGQGVTEAGTGDKIVVR